MNDDDLFETRFIGTLDDAAYWIKHRSSKYSDFGDTHSDEVHFMLQRTILPPAMLGDSASAIPRTVCNGVHLKQISVPEARRRRRYATRVIDHLLTTTRASGLDYLFIESVLSDEMHMLIRGRSEFVAVPLQPNCYVAVFAQTTTHENKK